MKHTLKVTAILLAMFFVTQLIGLYVVNQYSPQIIELVDEEGNVINITTHNLPAIFEPPQDTNPQGALVSIIFAIIIAVFVMFALMKYEVEIFLRLWFFLVVALALSLTFNAIIMKIPSSFLIAIVIATPLAYFKIFQRNIIVHNLTELAIYPGIAAIFVPILSIWTVVLLIILISLYDMYAVWHAGFMQKMAKYQIQKLKVFSGFFVPYFGKKEKEIVKNSKTKNKKVKVSVAILGGGDVVFPIILAGVVLMTLGLVQAIIISIGATLALALLFKFSEKGKFYPAMPFISTGCFIALAIAYLI